MSFRFAGEVPASKSELIRALVLRSYEPDVRISGDSSCDDVLHARRAVDHLMSGKREIDCGEGGLVLRLLLARVSRIPGEFVLHASTRLLERPHGSLISALENLGVEIHSLGTLGIAVLGQGWQKPSGPIAVEAT